MSGSGLSQVRGGGVFLSLKLLIVILTTLSCCILVFSAPHRSSESHKTIPKLSKVGAIRSSLKHKCGKAQLRAYNLEDLLRTLGLINASEAINQPAFLMLKRCDCHTGSCPSTNQVCVPLETYPELIDIELSQLRSGFDRSLSMRTIMVEQHDTCRCEHANLERRIALEDEDPKVYFV